VVLADVSAPLDTSALPRCSENEFRAACAALRLRLIRRRTGLLARNDRSRRLDVVLAALRRLQGESLAGYRLPGATLLSEPFGALPSVVPRAGVAVTASLVGAMLGRAAPAELVEALAPFGETVLRRAVRLGVRIAIVPQGKSFTAWSPSVAALVPDIDVWNAPPAGLFVLCERLVLLRRRALRMTAAHEFAHALDSTLARKPTFYFSFEDDAIRSCFTSATGFVNEYAASGLDEYFAEAVRAYFEVNDARSSWLPPHPAWSARTRSATLRAH